MTSNNYFDLPVEHDAFQPITRGGSVNYMLKKSSVGKLRALERVRFVQTTSGTSSVFSSANVQTSFLLPSGASNQLDVCERLILQNTFINNSSSAVASMLPFCYIVDRIEIVGSDQLEILYSQNLFEDRIFYSKDDAEILVNQSNEMYTYSAASGYAAGATIAAGAQFTANMEIPCFITRTLLFLKSIQQNLTINVYYNSSAVTTSSSSQSVSLLQSRLYMTGYVFEESIQQKLIQRYNSIPHYLFYNQYEYTTLPGEVISNTGKSNIRLGQFSNKNMTDLVVSVIDDNAVQQNKFNFYPLAYLDEKDNGTSLYADSLNIPIYKQMEIQTFWTSAPEAQNNIVLPHSVDVFKAVTECSSLGCYKYSPNVTLEPQGVTNLGSKTLVITGHSQVQFKIENGIITKSAV